MIITVTMNPAVDKTVEIGELRCGGLNRVKRVVYDAGGKGINVSRTIRELGGSSLAVGFLGGSGGQRIADELEKKGIPGDFIWVDGETRTNTKVLDADGRITEFNEPGPQILPGYMEQLMEKLDSLAAPGHLFVLAGSVPPGVPKNAYQEIVRRVHAKGADVMVDADGELFRNALEAAPDMIKPNLTELEVIAHLDRPASLENVLKITGMLMRQGIDTIAVSMGRMGALFVSGDYRVMCPALPVKVSSTVGAGDAMVAAMAFAREQKLGKEEMVRLCMAVAAGAVTTVGTKPPSRELAESLMEQVILNQM